MNRTNLDFTVVIPTLVTRLENLNSLVDNFLSSEYACNIIFICPENAISKLQFLEKKLLNQFSVQIVAEAPGSNLPKAINQCIPLLKTNYWNWLGDDDSLFLEEVKNIIKVLDLSEDKVISIGSCLYRSTGSKDLFVNEVSSIKCKLIWLGPNMLSQPSIVFKTKLSRIIGGLNENYRFAFDQDFIMRNLALGDVYLHKPITSNYRFGLDTLTSSNRFESIYESFRIRLDLNENPIKRTFVFFTFPITASIVLLSHFLFRIRFRK